MERNADDTFNVSNQGLNQGASPGMTGDAATSSTSFESSAPTPGATTTADEAANRFQRGKEVLQDRLGTLKERASNLQSTLADKLDAGADRLRQRAHSGTMAPATAGATVSTPTAATTDRVSQVSDSIASGMHGTADWLRNGDLQADLERQVREHPGRSLLIALGLGYLIGKAVRR